MSRESTSDSIDQLFTAVEHFFATSWDSLSSGAPNLHDLPSQLHDQLTSLFDKVTNNHTLPLPSWNDLPASPWSATEAVNVAAQAPPPPTHDSPLKELGNKVFKHPYLIVALATSLTGATAYYMNPSATKRLVSPLVVPLRPYIPLALLPKSSRPLRVLPTKATPGLNEIRKEAVLVLGAHGIVADLALDLESRGFVVVATVRNPSEVDALEKRSRGWMKVLVLDPTESSSVQPFTRSLSTALSLRYPLHTAGDPFSRPSHALALTAVVNGLSIVPPNERHPVCPLEGIQGEDIRREIGERVSTTVAVIKAVLPLLRTAASRPGQSEGVLLSLFPTTSANISLPFQPMCSAADAAIISLLHSLRRELAATRSSNVRIAMLETGFFDATQMQNATSTPPEPVQLPLRLSSLYAPALQRRTHIAHASAHPSSSGAGSIRTLKRRLSQPRRLHQKVFDIIVYSRGGTRSSVGSGALTYRVLSFLPHAILDALLSAQDRMYAVYLAHRSRLQRSASASSSSRSPLSSSTASSASSSTRARPPLPTPPSSAAQHPTSLRPGYASAAASQVPLGSSGDPFTSSPQGNGAASSGDETSSVEDFGPLGDSFVDVEHAHQ